MLRRILSARRPGCCPGVLVEVVDARDARQRRSLAPWRARGRTVALVGSSGVGKSTLINTLIGTDRIATQGVRETTTRAPHDHRGARCIACLPAAGWSIRPASASCRSPMSKAGIDEVFADIVALALTCRFGDCRHESEPGCAVRAAIEAGTLEPTRVGRWRKLAAEERTTTQACAERAGHATVPSAPRRPRLPGLRQGAPLLMVVGNATT